MRKHTQRPKKVHSQLISKPTHRSNRMHYYDAYEGSNVSVFFFRRLVNSQRKFLAAVKR
jgi:hypothetical protein